MSGAGLFPVVAVGGASPSIAERGRTLHHRPDEAGPRPPQCGRCFPPFSSLVPMRGGHEVTGRHPSRSQREPLLRFTQQRTPGVHAVRPAGLRYRPPSSRHAPSPAYNRASPLRRCGTALQLGPVVQQDRLADLDMLLPSCPAMTGSKSIAPTSPSGVLSISACSIIVRDGRRRRPR